MTITRSGVMCDVCKEYILPGFSKSVNPFSIKGIKGTFHCHDDCKPTVLEALKEVRMESMSEKLKAAQKRKPDAFSIIGVVSGFGEKRIKEIAEGSTPSVIELVTLEGLAEDNCIA